MRTWAARRILWASAVALVATGCGSRGAVNFEYTLFADDAQIAAVDHAGQPWCADGSDPAVSVVATLAATVAQTSEKAGLTPAWREPLVEADLAAYRQGLSIDVRGRCGSDSFYMGRALLHPDARLVQSQGVALGPIGNVTRLRLHFEAAPAGGGDDGAYVAPAFGYGDDDYGWYDPDPTADDPGYDWGDAPADPGDDGSADPGDCCSDGSGDPGDGWSDPGDGSGGDVGDSGGDAGGDSGDSGADFRRAHRRRAVNALRRR